DESGPGRASPPEDKRPHLISQPLVRSNSWCLAMGRGGQGGGKMSDHFDGPDFTPAGGDPRLDLTDLYAFAQPDDPARSVVVLDVNPFAAAPKFHPDAVYKI